MWRAFAISILYRYGPSREHAKWRWVSLGGIVATALWLVIAMVFSWYLSNFANYNAHLRLSLAPWSAS